MSKGRPVSPVKPVGMELILYYPCPKCERNIPLLAPSRPAVAKCDGCGREFPVVPADDKTLGFLRIMLRNGTSCIDPDYL